MARGRIGEDGVDEAIEGGELVGVLLTVALAEADWLKGGGEGGEGSEGLGVVGAEEAAQGYGFMGEVGEADGFEADGLSIEAAVHVVDVGSGGLGRPEAFCDGGGAGPDAGVDGDGVDVLGPHAGFAAEDEGLLGGGEGGVYGDGVGEVVLFGGLHAVEVVGLGEDALVAEGGGFDEGPGAAPGLDDDVFGEAGVEDFIPADHVLLILLHDGEEALVEVDLERVGVLEVVGAHEGDDAGVGLPLLAVALVASYVEVGIGEEAGHFADEGVEEFVGGVACGIDGGIVDAKLAADGVGAGATGKVGIADEPGAGVSGHVELGDDADATGVGVGDDVADLILGVEEAVGAESGEAGKELAFDAEALVLGEVPVEDVELDGSHSVEIALDDFDGDEVAAGVDVEPAPTEAGGVFDVDGGEEGVGAVGLDELLEGGEAAHGSDGGGGVEGGRRGGDGEGVAFAFVDGLNGLAGAGYINEEGRCGGGENFGGDGGGGVGRGDVAVEVVEGAEDGGVEAGVVEVGRGDGESGGEGKLACIERELGGEGEESGLDLGWRLEGEDGHGEEEEGFG